MASIKIGKTRLNVWISPHTIKLSKALVRLENKDLSLVIEGLLNDYNKKLVDIARKNERNI